jgi:SAM-dependent methyltransferase
MIEASTGRACPPTLAEVAATLTPHVGLYRWRAPIYQTALLRSLCKLWDTRHKTVLDVGGGNGLLAHALGRLFPVDRVVSIDISDRFLPGLDIETQTFDGGTLPFADASFDCLLLVNVLHHVPLAGRAALLRECGRVSKSGVVYIKDHLPLSGLDHLRLTGLDLIGNVPFGGMVAASYLVPEEWLQLAQESQFAIAAWNYETYRTGLMQYFFPNRLEVLMKWTLRSRC